MKIIRIIKLTIVFLLSIYGVFSCKSTHSVQSGIILSDGDTDTRVYYLKVLDEDELEKFNKITFRYAADCLVCIQECDANELKKVDQITKDNVNKICNKNTKITECVSMGFNKTNKLYNKYQDNLSSEDITVINQMDSKDFNKYIDILFNTLKVEHFTDPNKLDYCNMEVGQDLLFSNGWKEIESDKIYQWKATGEYYHATNEIRYDTKEEAIRYCQGLNDLGYSWRLISDKEFDTVNIDRQIAIFIPSRMHLEPEECFFTSDSKGGMKTFSDDDKTQVEKCSKSTKGLSLCISNG